MTAENAVPAEREHLLLDELTTRLESLRFLTETDEAQIDSLIESFSTEGTVEATMLEELASTSVLAHPDRFDEAHRRLIRSFEVYDRNSIKAPSALRVPRPLRPLATRMVQALIFVIVRMFQKRVLGEVRTLYALREANAPTQSPERDMLTAARAQIDLITPNLTKATSPLPAFLMGGAVISGTASLVRRSLVDEWGQVAVGLAFVLIGLAMFWCVIKASAIARRRSRLVMGPPVAALWEVVGQAGVPPRDRARLFAVLATLVLLAAWIVVPVILALVWTRI